MNKRLQKFLLAVLMIALISTQALTNVHATDQSEEISEEPISEVVDETTEVEEPQEQAIAKERSTDLITSILENPQPDYKFVGGDTVTFFSWVTVSGSETKLDAGAYTIIKIPAKYIKKLENTNVETGFSAFDSLEFKQEEGAEFYSFKLTYKELAGGYSAGVPFTFTLLGGQQINNNTITLTQEFYNSKGELVNQSTADFKTAASLFELDTNDTVSASKRYPINMWKSINESGIVNNQTDLKFKVGYELGIASSDNRDRRIYVTFPYGLKPLESDTQWQLEESSGRYYTDKATKDIRVYSGININVDIGGLDLSANSSVDNPKEVKLVFEIFPIENGQIQHDLNSKTWSAYKHVYTNANTYWGPTSNFTQHQLDHNNDYINKTIIDTNYNYFNYSQAVDKDVRVGLNVTNINNAFYSKVESDAEVEKVTLQNTKVSIPDIMNPVEFRLSFENSKLSSEKKNDLVNRLKGTKVYGVTATGNVLLAELNDVYFKEGDELSFGKEKWTSTLNNEHYEHVLFEYPNGGITFENDEANTEFVNSFKSQVIIKANDKLKGDIDTELAKDTNYSSLHSEYITINGKWKTVSSENKPSVEENYTIEAKFFFQSYNLEYGKLSATSLKVENDAGATTVFPSQILNVNARLDLHLYGMEGLSSTTKNLTAYVLVPNGFVPVQDSSKYLMVDVNYNYVPGKSLVVYKLNKEQSFTLNRAGNRYYIANYNFQFTINDRVKEGDYKVAVAFLTDNNTLVNNEGSHTTGLLTSRITSNINEFANISELGYNNVARQGFGASYRQAQITVRSLKTLKTFNEVKQTSQSDNLYAPETNIDSKSGSDISYRWNFINDSDTEVNKLAVINVLPYENDHTITPNKDGEYTDRGSKFSTPLKEAPISDRFDFLYATSTPPESVEGLNSVEFSSTVSDYSKVTMIKAVLKDGQKIGLGEEVGVITNNFITANPSLKEGDKAVNSYAITFNDGASYIEALSAQAKISLPKTNVNVEKVDSKDSSLKLGGATFNVYTKDDALVYEGLVTSTDGTLSIPKMVIGEEYYMKETVAPEGYQLSEDKIEFTVKGQDNNIIVKNDAQTNKDITVEKVWVGGRDVKPTIEIQLYKNGIPEGNPVKLEDGTTSYTWKDMDISDADGNKYVYSVDEKDVANYSKDIDGLKITNTYIPEVKDITGTVTWDDESNLEGLRPEDTHVLLYANGSYTKYQPEWVKGEENVWTYTFKGIPVLSNGKEIIYDVTEQNIFQYSIKQEGYNFINSRKIDKISIQVNKVWKDESNKDGTRPENIDFVLYANGEMLDIKPSSIVKSNDKWTITYKDVAYYSKGKAINYTIDELDVKGYTKDIKKIIGTHFLVTNTHVPGEEVVIPPVTPPVDPVKPVDPKENVKPKDKSAPTGVDNNTGTLILIATLALCTGAITIVFSRKKKEKNN